VRAIHRLTTKQVTTKKPPGNRRSVFLADGGNLLLQISRSTKPDEFNRSWVFRYELDGTRRDLGLGSIHDLNLAEARTKARELRQQLLNNIDPYTVRQQARADRLAQAAERARVMTFKQCAVGCMESHEAGWTNAEHRRQWATTLEQYVYPIIGDLPVDEISTPHVVKVLQHENFWKTTPETASRVRSRIEKVLGWATVRGFRSGDNPARWRGHLAELFPKRGKIAPTKNHEAMPYTEVPAFMTKLREREHPAVRALEFAILTAARTGEVRGATWEEIDLLARTWTIPGARMKAGKEHKVPLSNRTIEILKALPHREGRIFEIGEVRMLVKLREVHGGKGPTVHGFRSSFRDWAAERTHYPELVAEQCLAHAVGTKVEKAYRRTDLFEKRRRLMAEWAMWCSRPVSSSETAKIVALHA